MKARKLVIGFIKFIGKLARQIILTLALLQSNFLFSNQSLFAGSCCGGGSSSGQFILGDEKAKIGLKNSATFSQGVKGDKKFDHGKKRYKELRTILGSAYAIGDYFQISQELSLLRRHGMSHLGDALISAGYEILPEKFYSPWRPQIFISSSLSYPFSDPGEGIGYGQIKNNYGLIMQKVFAESSILLNLTYSYLFPRSYGKNSSFEISSYQGLSASLNYSRQTFFTDLGASLGLSYSYQGPKFILEDGFIGINVPSRHVLTINTGLSYGLKDGLGLLFSYSDDYLLKKLAKNSQINRVLTLGIIKSWDR